MSSIPGEFSDATLNQLLLALQARTETHPENPGLIAAWPHVREERMSAACRLLIGRGYPVFRVSVPAATPGQERYGWAVRGTTDEPLLQL
jgi:hypothetical protein